MLLALGDDADEVADRHHGADAGDVRDGRFVHRFERVADEVAVVRARIGRAHHAPVQHAGRAHVVHEDQLARELGRDVDARLRAADDAVVLRVLQARAAVELQHGACARHQLAEADAEGRVVAGVDAAFAHRQQRRLNAEALRRLREKPAARLRGREPQRLRMDLQRGAGDGRALVRRACGVAEHHVHLRERQVEFLGDDLRERGADAGAEVDMAVERGDAAVVPQREQDLGAFRRIAEHDRRLAVRDRWRRRRLAHDQQHAVGREEVAAA